MNDKKLVKVNIGSGFIGLKDWINYDNSIVAKASKFPFLIKLLVRLKMLPSEFMTKWPPIKIRDGRKKMPLKNNSVDFVYTSHFLEHLYRHETIKVLFDSYRVLKSGGTIRIAVPDLDKLIDIYNKKDYKKFTMNYFDKNLPFTGADLFSAQFYPFECNQVKAPGLFSKFQELFLRRHKWMYNYDSMKCLLKHAGFVNIQKKEYCKGFLEEDIKKLDNHPDTSLFIEAEKP